MSDNLDEIFKNKNGAVSNQTMNPHFLQFDSMKNVLVAYNKMKDELMSSENISKDYSDKNIQEYGNFQDVSQLEMAEAWVHAYAQSTGQNNPGVLAFDSNISKEVFEKGIRIAKEMQDKTLEEFAHRITVEFAFDDPMATKTIIYFISDPRISKIFNIDCSNVTSDVAAENIVDNLLGQNTSASFAILQEAYKNGEMFVPIVENKEETANTPYPNMPKLTVQDFSPKAMYDMYGNIDFDGENLIIIGPDGETVIDENPDEKLVKTAMFNRIWKVTCLNMEPDPDDERIAEINRTLFDGDNAILLDKISRMLNNDQITSVDTILRSLASVEGVQNERLFMHKAFDYLSNLAQFGGLDLDFKGTMRVKDYIELMQENGGPERQYKP